jgi:hypothetical protein
MHVIHRVGIDSVGRIATVEWQLFDRRAGAAVGETSTVPVLEVVDEIMKGGRVVMAAGDGYLPGAEVTVFADETGHEWIRLNSDGAPSLHDLPRLP